MFIVHYHDIFSRIDSKNGAKCDTERVGSGSGLSGPFSEVAVKMPMEYWLPFGLVLLFQILCFRASPFRISYFAL